MKKLSILALTALFAVSAPAQVFKQVKKLKDAAQVTELINANLSSMPNEEKAQCYNYLSKLAQDVAAKEIGVITENNMNKQLGKPESPYDTFALNKAVLDAIEAAELCCKYDNMENSKGKVKPQFKDAGTTLFQYYPRIIDGAQYYMDKQDKETAFKYLTAFVDKRDSELFAAIPAEQKQGVESIIPQIAYFSAVYGVQLGKPLDDVEKYCKIAETDPKYKKEAEGLLVNYTTKGLKTKADSIAYAEKIEAQYAADPTNINVFQSLANIELALNRTENFYSICEKRIESAPNDYLAYYFRGYVKCTEKKWEDARPDLEKADELMPNNSAVNAMIGTCWMAKAEEGENRAAGKSGIVPFNARKVIKPFWQKALEYLNKAKEYDKDGSNAGMYDRKIQRINYLFENDYSKVPD